MSPNGPTPRRALVTGASGGIGFELAQLFAADGWDLVLAARGADKLTEAAAKITAAHPVQVQTVPIDLSTPRAAEQLVAACHNAERPIMALVNNAGFGQWGPFAQADLEVTRQMIHLNIEALTDLTGLLLPPMVAARTGYVLNVASMAAFQPGPLMAVYYASKAYVLHFSEAIADELERSGVKVTALCPGPTETGFMDRAAMAESRLFRSGVMSAAEVARKGYAGLLRGNRLVIPSFKFKLLAAAGRLAPRIVLTKIARAMQERR